MAGMNEASLAWATGAPQQYNKSGIPDYNRVPEYSQSFMQQQPQSIYTGMQGQAAPPQQQQFFTNPKIGPKNKQVPLSYNNSSLDKFGGSGVYETAEQAFKRSNPSYVGASPLSAPAPEKPPVSALPDIPFQADPNNSLEAIKKMLGIV